jgi:hypothetical protein
VVAHRRHVDKRGGKVEQVAGGEAAHTPTRSATRASRSSGCTMATRT